VFLSQENPYSVKELEHDPPHAMTRVVTSPGFTRGLRVSMCHLRAQGLIIISPGHPSRHTANFYFIFLFIRSFEVRDICWRFVEVYLNFIR
jgi:hypothetical protein